MCALIAAIMMTTSGKDLGVTLPLVIFVSSHALLPVRDFVIFFLPASDSIPLKIILHPWLWRFSVNMDPKPQ